MRPGQKHVLTAELRGSLLTACTGLWHARVVSFGYHTRESCVGTIVRVLRGEKGRSMAEAPDRYCSNCGRELSTEDRFCPNCGRPVHQTATVPTPEAEVSVPPPPQTGGAGGAGDGDAAAAQTPPQESGSSGIGNLILRGGGIIVVAILLFIFVYILIFGIPAFGAA